MRVQARCAPIYSFRPNPAGRSYTIIKGGWVSELTHAAYLGKELMRAQLSMEMDFTYV
jgi:hypothetical protein